jgi:hypothetical protein
VASDAMNRGFVDCHFEVPEILLAENCADTTASVNQKVLLSV